MNLSLSEPIDYFNSNHRLAQIQSRISLKVRRHMWNLCLQFANGIIDGKILDVGTTPDLKMIDSNCFLRWIVQETSSKLFLYSPENLEKIQTTLPGSSILDGFDANRIPEKDRNFNWVISSATLEHVGNLENQCLFLKECARVSDGIFITTPDRAHWLEFHTKLPFLHWLPKKLHRKVLSWLGHKFWNQEANLNLLNYKELKDLASSLFKTDYHWQITRIRSLGYFSHLILMARRKELKAFGPRHSSYSHGDDRL